jgi:NUMOD3 motif-containing protein
MPDNRVFNPTIYRLWHGESDAGRVGYVGKDSYYPLRANLKHRLLEPSCTKLYRALLKYPFECWRKEVLADGFKDDESLNAAEIFWIAYFDSKNKGYNCTEGGEGQRGRAQSEETKEKLRKINLGKKASEATKKKMRENAVGMTGKKHSQATKEKLRIAKTGTIMSPESSMKKRIAMIGQTHSEETKEMIRQMKIGTKYSLESREKMRQSRLKWLRENKRG